MSVQTACSDDDRIRRLLQIFPFKSNEEVTEILKSSGTLEEATNRILDCSSAEDILNERSVSQKCHNYSIQSYSEFHFYWAGVIKVIKASAKFD